MTKQYNFYEAYPGPLGPHLNHLSFYTISRKDEDRLRGRSIRGGGKNTCKAPTGARRERAVTALREHLSRHPNDKQSETHLAKLTA